MPSKKRGAIERPLDERKQVVEGEHLSHLLQQIRRAIESERHSGTCLPEKFWYKQQFSIGVNEVTRVLERMPKSGSEMGAPHSSVKLQAILLADDCNPRFLTKHLPGLASSRNVPLIFVKDKRAGSIKLGEIVKLKTAIAIGVKDKGSPINETIEEILHAYQINAEDAFSQDN